MNRRDFELIAWAIKAELAVNCDPRGRAGVMLVAARLALAFVPEDGRDKFLKQCGIT